MLGNVNSHLSASDSSITKSTSHFLFPLGTLVIAQLPRWKPGTGIGYAPGWPYTFALTKFRDPDQPLSRQSLSPDLQVRINLLTWSSGTVHALRLKGPYSAHNTSVSPIKLGLVSLGLPDVKEKVLGGGGGGMGMGMGTGP